MAFLILDKKPPPIYNTPVIILKLMLAIIETGGKQYLVSPDQKLNIPKLEVDEGGKVVFDKVLLMADEAKGTVQVGAPYVEGAKVEAVVEKQGRARKIIVLKYKPKTRYRIRRGHRQHFTKVKIA